jgi:SAM-dependent methyltransferase
VADARATYDAMAADYLAAEGNPYNDLYEQPNLRALLPPVAGRRVLDAGCGAGRTAVWLVDQGAEVVGVDLSPELLQIARERVPGASFAVADLARRLPFEDGSFDVVVASLVMHYLRDWVPTLRELRRVLRADGVVVLSTHHPAMDVELSASGDYFAVELLHDRWTVGEGEYDVQFWHRPLSAMFREIRDGGFRVDELAEPQPLPEVRERFPDAWERLTKNPHFLFLRLTAGTARSGGAA